MLANRITSFKRQQGFTLLEVLVSIAIITVLGILLNVSMGMIRQKSDEIGCLTNLRKIGMAINLYATDNDGRLPGPSFFGQLTDYHPTMPNFLVWHLAEYLGYSVSDDSGWVKTPEFRCPSWERLLPDQARQSAAICYMAPTDIIRNSTLLLKAPFGDPRDDPPHLPLRLNNIPQPLSTVWAMTHDHRDRPELFHGDKETYLFFDGHVEAIVPPFPNYDPNFN